MRDVSGFSAAARRREGVGEGWRRAENGFDAPGGAEIGASWNALVHYRDESGQARGIRRNCWAPSERLKEHEIDHAMPHNSFAAGLHW